MPVLRSEAKLLLAKIETTSGTDASPAATTDAVAVENLTYNFNPNIVDTNEIGSSLDDLGPIVAGMTAEISFDLLMKGSGAAGTAPEYGKLLRACGWAETISASAVPAAPEACAAGGSTTSAVLGASASTTAQIYRGMPINFTGTVAGSSFITDYTAGKAATLADTMSGAIIATTNYQIPANVLYSPASANIPTLTMYVYEDGLLHKFVGCAGDKNAITLKTGEIGRLGITMRGIFSGKTDVALPANAVFDATRPPKYLGGKALLDRKTVAISQFSLDNGLTLVFPEDPNAAEGVQPPVHTGRKITGSIDPLASLVATQDILADFRAGTRKIFHTGFGVTAGNRVGITIPQTHYRNQSPASRNGLSINNVPFSAVGRDAGAFICFY